MMLELNGEIAEAQQARAVGLRKNPVYRIRVQLVPLLQNIFRRADEVILAMEARCYSENRTDPEFSAKRRDWVVLLGSVLLALLILIG